MMGKKDRKHCLKSRICYFAAFSQLVNPLPDDNILDWSKLKQIADDILTSI